MEIDRDLILHLANKASYYAGMANATKKFSPNDGVEENLDEIAAYLDVLSIVLTNTDSDNGTSDSVNDASDSDEVSDKEAEDAMSTLANYCCQKYCAEDDCIFYDDNDCLLFDTRPKRFETREMREKTLHGTGDKADR